MAFKSLIFTLLLFFIFRDSQAQFYFEKDRGEFEEKTLDLYSPTRYNRVEGLFLSAGLKFNPPWFKIWGDVGYDFLNREWRYHLGLEKGLFEINRQKLGLCLFNRTASNEDWIISDLENSLFTLFSKEDFKDYFCQRGWLIYINQRFKQVHNFRIEYNSLDYQSLKERDIWSLFGRQKKVRLNPSVVEKRENKLRVMLALDLLDNPFYPINGWYFEGIYERAGKGLGGDFDFEGIFLTIKMFQHTIGNQRLVIRTRFGAREGDLAEQHKIDLGGISTLRGFKYKELTGSRMFTMSLDYFFAGDVLGKFPLGWIPLYDALNLILFIDSGLCWDAGEKIEGLKTNIGLSLALIEEILRVDFAKRLDRGQDTWAVSFRVMSRL